MATFSLHDSPSPTPEAKYPTDIFNGLIDAAGGKPLPGIAGLIQAAVTCWSQPRHNTWPALHYTKLALNTAGIVRQYRQANDPAHAEARKDPLMEYLRAKNMVVVHGAASIANMILVYSQNVPYSDVKIGTDDTMWLRTYTLPSGLSYAYIMSKAWDTDSRTPYGIGPYAVASVHDRFMSEINELIWSAEGYDDLQLSVESGSTSRGGTAFSLSNIGEADEYIDTTQEWKSLAVLAARCGAFAARGIGRNILFYGPPGTGKTSLARRIARQLGGGRTLRIEASAVQRAGVSAVLSFVTILRPRVILFDDLDRCMDHIVELLHCFEQAKQTAGDGAPVIVIGTVNVVESLDPALLRPGRFDETVKLDEPDESQRRAITAHYAARFGASLDPDQLAHETGGFSPADLRELCQVAGIVGSVHIPAEIARIRLQRGLYSGDACLTYNRRSRGEVAMR